MGNPNYSAENINKLILGTPGLRTTKEHLFELNKNSRVVEFRPSYAGHGNDNGYRIYLTGYAQFLLKLERSYDNFSLQKDINSLRARPRPSEAGFRDPGSIDTWVMDGTKHHLFYKITPGQILVFNITVKKSVWKSRASNEEAALYKVTLGGDGEWKRQRVARVTTQYAAINGILNNLHKATWLMAEHLKTQFKGEVIKEFTLFHNPSRGALKDAKETMADHSGKTQAVTKAFADILVQTQDYGNPVKWIAHSQGGLIFKQAVVWLNNGRRDQPMEVDNNDDYTEIVNRKVKPLNKHSVAFRAAPVNDRLTEAHMKAAKINVIGIHTHPHDAVSKILGFNTLNPITLFKSLANLPSSIGGTPYTSTHTLAPDKKTLDKWRKEYPKQQWPKHSEGKHKPFLPIPKSV